MRIIVIVLAALLMGACSTVPDGGYYSGGQGSYCDGSLIQPGYTEHEIRQLHPYGVCNTVRPIRWGSGYSNYPPSRQLYQGYLPRGRFRNRGPQGFTPGEQRYDYRGSGENSSDGSPEGLDPRDQEFRYRQPRSRQPSGPEGFDERTQTHRYRQPRSRQPNEPQGYSAEQQRYDPPPSSRRPTRERPTRHASPCRQLLPGTSAYRRGGC